MAIVGSARAGLHAIELGATILQLRALDLTARELERDKEWLQKQTQRQQSDLRNEEHGKTT